MFKIQKLDKISPSGLARFPADLYEHAADIANPDAILVRSADMHTLDLPPSLLAIARAGAGVNNIPLEKCSQRGIVVFNTPGANANAVKELVIMALLIASRRVSEGIIWAKSLAGKGEEVPLLIEKDKSKFIGPEILGKKLGVIGLGAVGQLVANDALSLGMDVSGYDPYISVEAAWGLSRSVRRAISLDTLISESDYITLHAPLNDMTKGMINRDKFALMKHGVRIMNFARGGLVNNRDLKQAIASGTVACYVTDFPDDELIQMDGVIPIPHLGASTPESEENCARMAVDQLREFLERGNLVHSVNFADCFMAQTASKRILIANKNIPAVIGQITKILADKKINIADMLNKSRGEYAYNIIDIDGDIDENIIKQIRSIKEILMVRVI
ncbi:MAG TPA: 3-phosphoglycerate dehydrogenase family protein [Spirochaetota bacterium]|nr:3-phosphoglycerate dehydrogenase family protein [Spirochaetota bacterium]HPC39531.1 3-phosphoglycerate dehydrogenase family protein [Spirochaetota bacterium]HPL15249.1 3-phosphoglycerate dehydrogenase family protein [Spirochaetota bacterium]HQF06868.1 3-phosphoglycerate dehydrogenase family protein [Spirochaetota bacterium]HQH95513.1 3-phosphoglycerate dehydrogenase family protein [Spirochaetota bacterium]